MKQRPVARYMDFANFSLPRNKGRPWKESLTETCRWIFHYALDFCCPCSFYDHIIVWLQDGTEYRWLIPSQGASDTVKQQSHPNTVKPPNSGYSNEWICHEYRTKYLVPNVTILFKLPPNTEHLSIRDKYFKTRRCPLFRGFTVISL